MRIKSACRITNDSVCLDNVEILSRKVEKTAWLKEIYSQMKIGYPKYFKMDRLSKVGFLAAEILLQNDDKEIPKENWAVLAMNSSSSLDDDCKHQEAIKDKENYFPSPAVFVYTLPNIVTGEIAIRHKILGETSFYVYEKFDAQQFYNDVNVLFENTNYDVVITCWIDYYNENCDVLMMKIEKGDGQGVENFTVENIKNYY